MTNCMRYHASLQSDTPWFELPFSIESQGLRHASRLCYPQRPV
jgi:hypothetical protein